MAESTTATVRKAFFISLCQADNNYSMEGVSSITLIPYTIWRDSETQQMQMVTYSQSMPRIFFSLILPWMPVTQMPLMMLLWVTNMSADLPFLIVFQPPLLYLSDWRIEGYLLYVFTGILERTWYNEYSYSLHLHFWGNISQIWKFSIDCGSQQRFDNQLSDWQLLHHRKALLGHFKLCFDRRQASWRPQHH
jgi:hypothetical protein